jgi:hypothetical protein
MDPLSLEQLLNESESDALDFKSAQYPFDGASDDEKSELLKDILSLANAWRRAEAYLLIGVEEVQCGRAKPVGVSKHLEDAKLQQFVNSKIQRPVTFSPEVVAVDTVEIDLISIPLQDRPLYLSRDYGCLKKETVYLRRGSSTAIAKPDEISRMGLPLRVVEPPKLEVVARPIRKPQRLQFVIGIENAEGAGSARAPYLSFTLPEGLFLAEYGLDGNGNDGLPRRPQPGSDHRTPKYAGDAGTVIHAGTTHDVTRIETRPGAATLPPVVSIDYQVAADGMTLVRGTLTLEITGGTA